MFAGSFNFFIPSRKAIFDMLLNSFPLHTEFLPLLENAALFKGNFSSGKRNSAGARS
jgi:hypothetical protein